MAILLFKRGSPGENLDPYFVHLYTNNTLAQVAAAGFINPYLVSQGYSLSPQDFVFVAASDGHQIYKPVFNGTTITLTVLP